MPPATLLEPDEKVLSTLNKDGSRRWLRPRVSRGQFLRHRRIVAYALIAIFVTLPHLRLGGKPLFLLDIIARQFTIFGRTFLPTDSLLLALLVVGVFLSIFLVTALFGRAWCGWACPQTVYLEFVFRPIERLFEGEPGRAKRTRYVGLRKAGKLLVFLILSMALAHTFLAYFVGTDALAQWVRRSPFEHPTSFLVMAGVTFLMLFDFGFFREQTCIVACPYGRMQSVLLDRNSLIVSYDKRRGEPRGRGKAAVQSGTFAGRHDAEGRAAEGRGAGGQMAGGQMTGGLEAGASADLSLPILQQEHKTSAVTGSADHRTGDCVDCGLCVSTCPTGIDIRQGLQMECISCTQCIDACDAVMTKLHRPTGLIRYTSQAALEYAAGEGPKPSVFRWRILLYPIIILIVGSAFLVLLVTASPVDISLARARGLPFNTLADGRISNQMTFKLTSRSPSDQRFTVTIEGPGAPQIELAENPVVLSPGQVHAEPVIVSMNRDGFEAGSAFALIKVADSTGRVVSTRSITLIGPTRHPDEHHNDDEKKREKYKQETKDIETEKHDDR